MKFTYLKSKSNRTGYPIEMKFTIENEDDLRALYGFSNFPVARIASFYLDSGRKAIADAVKSLDKKCFFDRVKSLCKERSVKIPLRPRS